MYQTPTKHLKWKYLKIEKFRMKLDINKNGKYRGVHERKQGYSNGGAY